MDAQDRRIAILQLRVISTQAELLSTKLENGGLWDGDYHTHVSRIKDAVRELPEDRGR